jgi:hypothetical protein
MNTAREARRDAKEYARAQMSYGEGAGTRRKLINATVESKADRNPEYARRFRTELEHQDMAEHAEKARHERERKDRTESFTKNTKALMTGNPENLQATLFVLVVAGYFIHQTGLDVKVYVKGKIFVADVKAKIRKYRNRNNTSILY